MHIMIKGENSLKIFQYMMIENKYELKSFLRLSKRLF